MSADEAILLFVAMVLLAALPSTSVLLVTARASALGLKHGVLASIGVGAGDIIYVLVAAYGMTSLMEIGIGWIGFLQFASGAYLVRLAVQMWRGRNSRSGVVSVATSSYFSSFGAGLFLTLSDQKAVLFYLAFLPAFVDLRIVGGIDVLFICGITFLAVGGVKVAYALAAARLGSTSLSDAWRERLGSLAALMVLLVGATLLVRSFITWQISILSIQ